MQTKMNLQARPSLLPLAAMLLAAMSAYLGLPQINLLSRLAPHAVQTARLAHPVLRAAHDLRLAEARTGSSKASELERERESGRRGLALIADAPNVSAVTAPALVSHTSTARQSPALAAIETTAIGVGLAVTPEVSKPPPGAPPPISSFAACAGEVVTRTPRGPPIL